MEELSLVISNPTENQLPKKIDWNKDEITAAVKSITEQYKGLQYTEDDMKSAKEDRARLNAMKKAISDKRIQVKKLWNAPIEVFEAEVKEITVLIDEPIKMIDEQTSEYENRIKSEKKEALEGYFEGLMTDSDFELNFDRIFEARYLNKTVSLKAAKDDIKAKIEKIKSDLATLSTIDNEFISVGKDTYMRTLDMTEAVREMTRLTDIKKKEREEAERKAQEEANKKAQEEAAQAQKDEQKAEQENIASNTEPKEIHQEVPTNIHENNTMPQQANTEATQAQDPFQEAEKKYKTRFYVIGTMAQINGLRDYMKENGIQFGKVEK